MWADVNDANALLSRFHRPIEIHSDRRSGNLAMPETHEIISTIGGGKREFP